MVYISDIKLIRTDTTLDLSQKAEKGMSCWPAPRLPFVARPAPVRSSAGDVGLTNRCTASKSSLRSCECGSLFGPNADLPLAANTSGLLCRLGLVGSLMGQKGRISCRALSRSRPDELSEGCRSQAGYTSLLTVTGSYPVFFFPSQRARELASS
jgi:hypothetical protein